MDRVDERSSICGWNISEDQYQGYIDFRNNFNSNIKNRIQESLAICGMIVGFVFIYALYRARSDVRKNTFFMMIGNLLIANMLHRCHVLLHYIGEEMGLLSYAWLGGFSFVFQAFEAFLRLFSCEAMTWFVILMTVSRVSLFLCSDRIPLFFPEHIRKTLILTWALSLLTGIIQWTFEYAYYIRDLGTSSFGADWWRVPRITVVDTLGRVVVWLEMVLITALPFLQLAIFLSIKAKRRGASSRSSSAVEVKFLVQTLAATVVLWINRVHFVDGRSFKTPYSDLMIFVLRPCIYPESGDSFGIFMDCFSHGLLFDCIVHTIDILLFLFSNQTLRRSIWKGAKSSVISVSAGTSKQSLVSGRSSVVMPL